MILPSRFVVAFVAAFVVVLTVHLAQFPGSVQTGNGLWSIGKMWRARQGSNLRPRA